ncbi:hypothetical protein BDN72DRAFT_897195 [Pluteus cervinus]|uniref:Uncharacterized protein n=1 Tax=Pluteus cervinus TaxID=181527 RepID=A0ACD3AUW0_9AGAR|nr:hypothetical protein BDN72DRAFT_897195 [Pluteus cervinus]
MATAPPSYDGSRVSANLSDAEIARQQAQVKAQITQSGSITDGIKAFSKDCFDLKKDFYNTLKELKALDAHAKLSTAVPLSDSFNPSIEKYNQLLKSVQTFAGHAAGTIVDGYNFLVEAASDRYVSKQELESYIDEFIQKKSSPEIKMSGILFEELRSALEIFYQTFTATVGNAELADVDIRAANASVKKYADEVSELRKKVDLIFSSSTNDWRVYLTYAKYILLTMLKNGIIQGLTDVAEAQSAVTELELAEKHLKEANRQLKDLLAKKAAQHEANTDALKAKIQSLIDEAEAIGDNLAKLPTLCDGILRRATSFKEFLNTPASSDPALKQREVDDFKLYGELWAPVRSAFIVFAATTE